jgi:CubicO group peptidase (beta-lactamase class C family)
MVQLKPIGLVFLGLLAAALPIAGAEPVWPLPHTTPAAAGISAERLDFMHRNLMQVVDQGKYSGYVFMLARDGKIADWRAHGWQNIAAKAPMQRDSIVRIFSMSKLITSTAVLKLMEDGRLKLTDPVEKYLPALKDRKVFVGGTADAPALVPAARSITIYDLLTHTSGYYYGGDWSADSAVLVELFTRENIFKSANLDEFISRVASLPLRQQPGTQFRYGISTDILGAVVEKVSGERLDVFFQRQILGPLGMSDTGFWVPQEKRGRLALIYIRDKDGTLIPSDAQNHNDVGPDHGLLSGGGGLYSTAGDYVRFAQMLLNGGRLSDVRILSRKTVELMTQNHIAHLADPHPNSKSEQGFGLGVRVITDLGESPTPGSVGAFGWDGAATTNVQIDPKERTIAILLCQHGTFNQDDIITTFTTGYYSALEN